MPRPAKVTTKKLAPQKFATHAKVTSKNWPRPAKVTHATISPAPAKVTQKKLAPQKKSKQPHPEKNGPPPQKLAQPQKLARPRKTYLRQGFCCTHFGSHLGHFLANFLVLILGSSTSSLLGSFGACFRPIRLRILSSRWGQFWDLRAHSARIFGLLDSFPANLGAHSRLVRSACWVNA